MKPRQILIVAALATAGGATILALAAVVAGAPSPTRPITTISPSPTPNPPTLPSQEMCRWKAAQKLAEAGLSGTVALNNDGVLRFDITCPPAHGQDADEAGTVDQAAQLVWTAFDIALALDEEACGVFNQVEVVILVQITPSAHISASVSATDLLAFGAGELDEDAFIRRVTYQVETP